MALRDLPTTYPRSFPAQEYEERSIHEAGHVAMLLRQGPLFSLGIMFVTIEDRKAAGEVCRLGLRLPLQKRAKCHMAGMAAQALFYERANPGVARTTTFLAHMDRCRSDLAALETETGIQGAEAVTFLGECMVELSSVWPQIEAIASELLHRGTLYHQEAEMVFKGRHHQLKWYRENRVLDSPPRPWLEGVLPGQSPGPWFEPMRRGAFFLDKVRGAVDRFIPQR